MFFCIQLIGFDDLMRFIIHLAGSGFFGFTWCVRVVDDVCDGDDLLGGWADVVDLFIVDMQVRFLSETACTMMALIWAKMFRSVFGVYMIHQSYFTIGRCIRTVWALVDDAARFTIFAIIFSASASH